LYGVADPYFGLLGQLVGELFSISIQMVLYEDHTRKFANRIVTSMEKGVEKINVSDVYSFHLCCIKSGYTNVERQLY
jgi:hypothetical protein